MKDIKPLAQGHMSGEHSASVPGYYFHSPGVLSPGALSTFIPFYLGLSSSEVAIFGCYGSKP